ncbi:MAG: hypothetical protein R3C45_22165 [Phycisphaerales bacterium]
MSAAEAVDVEELSRQILEVPVDQELPGELSGRKPCEMPARYYTRRLIIISRSCWMEEHHTELPADEQITDELDEETLLKRWMRNEDRWGTWQGLSDHYLEARTLVRKHRLTSVLESARSMKFPRLLPPDEHAGLLYKAFMYAIGVRFPEDDKPQPKDPRIKEISRFLLEAEDTLQKEKGGVDAGEPKPKIKKKSTKAKRR